MASSPLRALILRLARLTLIGPAGRFIVGLVYPIKGKGDVSVSSSSSVKGLKVIACGFGRSGSVSLRFALDRLGLKCYHASHLYEGAIGHPTCEEHPKLWLQAATEANWNNWEQILDGYSAIASFPAACFYRRLMEAYPNAKVILNVRDPAAWHRSYMDTFIWYKNKLFFQVFVREAAVKFMEIAYMKGIFEGRFEDKDFAINVYERHVEEVKRIVPKEKLLVYESKEGWAPLCQFLQVDIPDTPFPSRNSTLTFRDQVKKRERAFIVFTAVYVGLMCWALQLLLKYGFRFFISR